VSNSIRTLPDLGQCCRSSLEDLAVSNNPLFKLPGWLFGLTELTTLQVANTSLTSIDDRIEKVRDKLTILDLSLNKGLQLPEIFGNLTNLEVCG